MDRTLLVSKSDWVALVKQWVEGADLDDRTTDSIQELEEVLLAKFTPAEELELRAMSHRTVKYTETLAAHALVRPPSFPCVVQ